MTIKFNTSETFLLSSIWNINYANNGFLLTIKAASGQTPVIDGQSLNSSVAQVAMNNVWIEGLTFQNADPANIAGCLIRADGTTNATFKNITYSRGYCAMRATTSVYNLTIDGAFIKQTAQGSFRLGNGTSSGIDGLWDMQNVNISNVVLVDDLNGGNIPGTSGPFFGLIVIKKCNGLTVKNMTMQGTGGVASSFVEIETSKNVDLQNIIATNFGRAIAGQSIKGRGLYFLSCNFVTVKDCYAKGFDDANSKIGIYMTGCYDISVQSSTFLATNASNIAGQFYLVKKVNSINGCIFVGLISNPALAISFAPSGYSASIATDFLEEKNNVFIAAGSYYTMLEVGGVTNNGGNTIKVQNQGGGIISPATWQSSYTRGQNSAFSFTPTDLSFMADGKHLAPTSMGRNQVASQIGTATTDASGLYRGFPTDCGAYDSDAY